MDHINNYICLHFYFATEHFCGFKLFSVCAQAIKYVNTSDLLPCDVLLADPSYPGCIPERGTALTNRRSDALPTDLAVPA